MTNSSEAVALIGTTAQLDFREEPASPSTKRFLQTSKTSFGPICNHESMGRAKIFSAPVCSLVIRIACGNHRAYK